MWLINGYRRSVPLPCGQHIIFFQWGETIALWSNLRYIPNKTSPKIGLNRCALRCALLVEVVEIVEVVDVVDVIEVVQVVEVVKILGVVKIVFAFVFGIPSIFPTSRLPTKGAICRWGILIFRDIKIAHPTYLMLFVLKAYLGSVFRPQNLFSRLLISH